MRSFGARKCTFALFGCLADQWTSVCREVEKGESIERKISYDGCTGPLEKIDALEHVEVHVTLEAPRRGDVNMFLVSPAGTR